MTIALIVCTLFLLATIIFVGITHSKMKEEVQPEVIFEAIEEPPYDRAVNAALKGGDLYLEVPVVQARLINDILVLDVKSEINELEGFEVAITNFDKAWLNASSYACHNVYCNVLLGPQGEATSRLINNVQDQIDKKLNLEVGKLVQAFSVSTIITDPADFCINLEANMPNGDTFTLKYNYATQTIDGTVALRSLMVAENYSPLALALEDLN